MITQKKMIIPIFNYKLTVVIFDKWEEMGSFLPKEEMEQEAKAITISNYGASLVGVNSKMDSSIVHEAEHVKNRIWEYIGYIAIASCGLSTSSANGVNAPTSFQAWEKECEDTLALQAAIYNQALNYQNNRFADRQTLNSELFSLWKGQIDADFGLYKSTRDGFDVLSAKQNQDAFNLYKSQRDADDDIRKELSDLKAQVAINAAVRPYQDKLIQCEIDKAFTAGINYTDRKTCKAIYGEVCLPNTPVVTGYVGANQCGCPRVVTGTTPTA